ASAGTLHPNYPNAPPEPVAHPVPARQPLYPSRKVIMASAARFVGLLEDAGLAAYDGYVPAVRIARPKVANPVLKGPLGQSGRHPRNTVAARRQYAVPHVLRWERQLDAVPSRRRTLLIEWCLRKLDAFVVDAIRRIAAFRPSSLVWTRMAHQKRTS